MIDRILQFLTDIWRGNLLGGVSRSSQWPRVRNEWLKENPNCAVTGDTKDCEVHHVIPFHEDKSLELNPKNFITLRRDMHFLFGHFLNWSSFNKDVRRDTEIWQSRISTRP